MAKKNLGHHRTFVYTTASCVLTCVRCFPQSLQVLGPRAAPDRWVALCKRTFVVVTVSPLDFESLDSRAGKVFLFVQYFVDAEINVFRFSLSYLFLQRLRFHRW